MTILFTHLGLSQSKLEMVPNGDFNQFDNYNIPFSVWKQKFAARVDFYGYQIWQKDIYNFKGLGLLTIGGLVGCLKEANTVFNLTSWYPIRDSQKINFGSILHQDTFHFFILINMKIYTRLINGLLLMNVIVVLLV